MLHGSARRVGHAPPRARKRARRRRVRSARRLLRRRGARRDPRARNGRRGDPPSASRSAGASPTSSSRRPTGGSRSPFTAGRRRPRTLSRSPPTRPRSAPTRSSSSARRTSCSTRKPSTRTSSPRRWRARRCRSTSTSSRATTGYAVAPAVLERLKRGRAERRRDSRCPTRRGSASRKYLLPGFDIFVGPEALIAQGMATRCGRRGVGARLGVPARGRRGRSRADRGRRRPSRRAPRVRRALPAPGGAQAAVALQGVAVREDVRAPLRGLTVEERDELDAWAETRARATSDVELLVDVGFAADEILRPADRLREILAEDEGAEPIRHSFQIHRLGESSSGSDSRSSSIDVFDSATFQMRRRKSMRYIRKTPKVVSGTGALAAAASPSASTRRVSSGSMIPSSQRRAVE